MRWGGRGRCCTATTAATTTTTAAAALRHALSFQSKQPIAKKRNPSGTGPKSSASLPVDTLAFDALAGACAAGSRVTSKLAIANEFP
jgi:hypothetical protein